MKFKRLSHFFLLSTCSVMFTLALGAEDNSETGATEETSAEDSSSTEEGPTAEELSSAEENTSEAIEDIFIPSQQISEDLSVSFPVNI